MPCLEGQDPADTGPVLPDPIDDPETPEIEIGNATSVLDPDGSTYVRFPISITNISFADTLSFNFQTNNGSASAGTHFIGASGPISIPPGESTEDIEITVIVNASFSGQKTFTVTLSSPTNCVLADASGTGTINYDEDTDPPPPPDGSSYTWWGTPVVYDQFGACAYATACTAFAGAAFISALKAHAGHGNSRFNAKKLFTDTGYNLCQCPVDSCSGHQMTPVLNEMKADTGARSGVQIEGVGHFKIRNLGELGGSNKTMAQVKTAIKNNIRNFGAVYMASIWYGTGFGDGGRGWNVCRSSDDYILRNFMQYNSAPGHTWVLTGWNDNKGSGGCFQIQSSHGTDWGQGGRGWIPYSYLTPNWPSGNGPRFRYWKAEWGGAV